MRIFISGVAGFLGSHLADRLLQNGHLVRGCDSLKHGGEAANLNPRLEFHQADTRDRAAMHSLLRDVDVVFHAAALGHDGFSVFSPHLIAENIFSGTTSLLSASAANRVKRFVYCSSMARYGDQPGPFHESMACRPVTPYGVAKVAGEEMVKSVCAAHSMEWVICVPHNIIGPRQKYDDPYRNVAAIMINRMLQGQQPLIYGDGNQRRCFSSVWDTLSVLEPLLFSTAAAGQTVNVGPDEEFVSISQLAVILGQIMGVNPHPIFLPPRPLEVQDATCSADKARRLFNYQTRYDLRRILTETVNWIRAQGPKAFQYRLPVELISERTPKSWLQGISEFNV